MQRATVVLIFVIGCTFSFPSRTVDQEVGWKFILVHRYIMVKNRVDSRASMNCRINTLSFEARIGQEKRTESILGLSPALGSERVNSVKKMSH